MPYGCCLSDDSLGDAAGLGNIPWGYLGQDGGDIMGPTLEEAAGGPVDTITAGDVAAYASTGSADPSILTQITNLFKVAGPAVDSIIQQVQFGQLASNTPISQLPALRTAITGTGSTFSTLFAGNNGLLLAGLGLAAVALFMRPKRK